MTTNSVEKGQPWNPDRYAEHGRFVSDLAAPVIDLLAPLPGERVLDIGCGDGALTAKIAARGAEVVGVDTSEEMVKAARGRGVDARVLSAEKLEFDSEFDAVFSNAALHWMSDQDAVLRGVRRSLKPGGRFVTEMGGHGNIAAIRVALSAVLRAHGQREMEENHFFTAAEYGAVLESQGFTVERIELIPRATPLKTGMRAWLETFRAGLLARLPAAEREAVVTETVAMLEPVLRDSAGNWTADYVRLRFRASVAG
jgi:trans-aconitate methyltransferase